MKAKAWRLYGAKDMRLEDIELEAAGDEGIVVELVTNTICLSDYKGVTLGTGHKRVQRDIATRPTMFGHEISCIVSGFRTNYHNVFCSHDLEVGIVDKGTMLLLAGCGAMGLGCIDIACHSPEKRPRRLVVTDIDDARADNPTSTGGGYDDIFLFAAVPALTQEASGKSQSCLRTTKAKER